MKELVPKVTSSYFYITTALSIQFTHPLVQ